MHELWRRIASTSGARLYAAAVGVVTLSVTARYLGPEGRGQVAAITTWVGMFATLGSLSLGQIAIHRAATAANGSAWLPEAFRVLGSITLAVSALGWLLALAIGVTSPLFGKVDPAWLALGFAMLPLVLWDQYGGSLLMAREQLHVSNRAQVAGRTLAVALVVVLVGLAGWGVPGALFATLLGQLLASAWSLLALAAAARPFAPPRWLELRAYAIDGIKLHLNAVGAFLISGMDVLMVNYYRGSVETGFYQLGAQLIGLMLIVPQAASMVVYGKVAQKGPDDAWPEHRTLLWQVLAYMVVASLLAGATTSWWLPLIAGHEFTPAVDLFRWQLPGVVGMTFSTLMAAQWIGRGYFWQASLLTLAVGAANFAANIALIPRYGMYGAVWASLGCYLFAVAGNGRIIMLCERGSRKAGR